jgi:hypothetical protein
MSKTPDFSYGTLISNPGLPCKYKTFYNGPYLTHHLLQLEAVTALLLFLILVMRRIVLCSAESEKWPHILRCIKVNIPPLDLNDNMENFSAVKASWRCLIAVISMIIQVNIYTSRVFSDDLLTLFIVESDPFFDYFLSFQSGMEAQFRPPGFALPEFLAYILNLIPTS